jgi:glyoxylase-like metal-dependent hydrolase (beta-lactamase superfamily II)
MDDVTFTYVVDGAMSMVPPRFFPAIPQHYWDDHPDQLNTHRQVAMSAGGLLVQRGAHRLLIDAGFGRITEDTPFGRVDSGEFLNTLHAIGVAPADIDVFALTHLHVDHTGWMFTETESHACEATFPNAPYVVADAEWAPLARGGQPAEMPDRQAVVEGLRRHPGRSLIADGAVVAPGVVAVVTPGHSMGHTSYVVTSSTGRRLVAFGDAFHVPAQLSHPHWGSVSDSDPRAVPAARMRIISELLKPDTYGFGFHFGDQPFGRVVYDDKPTPVWQPIHTTALYPPPRAG